MEDLEKENERTCTDGSFVQSRIYCVLQESSQAGVSEVALTRSGRAISEARGKSEREGIIGRDFGRKRTGNLRLRPYFHRHMQETRGHPKEIHSRVHRRDGASAG